MNTSNCLIASINCADTVIIAISGNIEGSEGTSLCNIASIMSTGITIVTNFEIIDTFSTSSIARIISACISIITGNWNWLTNSIGNIALIGKAIEFGADYRYWIFAFVTINSNITASSLRVATVSSARVIVITIYCGELASNIRIARSIMTGIWGIANDWREITTIW